MERGVEFGLGMRRLADQKILHRQHHGNFGNFFIADDFYCAVIHPRRLIHRDVERNVKPLILSCGDLVFTVFFGGFHRQKRVGIPSCRRAVFIVNVFHKDIFFMVNADVFLCKSGFSARKR